MLFGKGKGEDPLALLQQGKFKEAARVLEAKLKRFPDDYSVKMRLAEAYEGDGRRDEAAGIYREEGEANLAGGDRSHGLALLKRALRLVPGEESLATRVAKLEGQPGVSSDQAFSFDVEVAAVTPEAQGEPSPGRVTTQSPAPEPPFEDALPTEAESQPAPPPLASLAPPQDFGARDLLSRLFPELDAEHLDLLASASRPRNLPTGDILVREEDQGDSLFIVIAGHLEARGHFDGRELVLATFGPGDIIGEVAFLNRVPRTATVTAVEPSSVIELPGAETRAHFAQFPDMQVLLESILYQRVDRTLQLVKQVDRDSHGHS
jgi:CRP/FNR family transcriptional regulator